MIVAGQIIITWDTKGQLQVTAPMHEREICCLMLCEAQRAILNHFPGLAISNGIAPPDIRSKN